MNAARDRRPHQRRCWRRRYQEKEDLIGPENMREAERIIMLNVIDNQWKDHLLSMDHLKEGIGLRGYGQKDPLIEYKKESFTMFQDMMDRIEDETIRYLFFLQVTQGAAPGAADGEGAPPASGNGGYVIGGGPARPVLPFSSRRRGRGRGRRRRWRGGRSRPNEDRRAAQNVVADFTRNIQRKKDKEMAELQFAGGSGVGDVEKKQAVSEKKAGRNDPCPCGSGKKYKKCHGA